MRIAATGNFLLMIKKGKADPEKCYDALEEIIKENYEARSNNEYSNSFDIKRAYALLMSDYVAIKAALTVLLFECDDKLIKFLSDRGYKIDLSTKTKYEQSIVAAQRKSDNIITKIMSKEKELKDMADKDAGGPASFEEVLASLSALLGFQLDRSITLAGFNEYHRIIKIKNAPKQNLNGRN